MGHPHNNRSKAHHEGQALAVSTPCMVHCLHDMSCFRCAGSSSNGAFSLLLNGEQRVLSNSKREDQVLQLKSPVTVIRVDKIIDTPGGYSNIQLSQVI